MIISTAEQLNVYLPSAPKVNIEKLISTALPSSPEGLMRIRNMLLDYNISAKTLATAISLELSLSARLMRLANSPFYAFGKSVTSIPMAINVVGTRALYDIVLMELTASAFSKQIRNSPYAKKIWEHSLAVAVIAREISKLLMLAGTEESFAGGLLHDIGKMALLAYDADLFGSIQGADDEGEMLMREKRTYGYNHTEVGSMIALRWRLPDIIGYTILHHHNASQALEATKMTYLIDVADVIANIKGYGLRQEDEFKLMISESAILLGLPDDFLEGFWDQTEGNIQEIIKAFS